MMSSGMTCSFSKPSAQSPMMKPSRLKVTAVSSRNTSIQTGWSIRIDHPVWMLVFLLLTAVTFSLLGFIIGLWADGFEKLQVVPLLVITPLSFLGGSFYSINVLPP